jgi:hypothetical protein
MSSPTHLPITDSLLFMYWFSCRYNFFKETISYSLSLITVLHHFFFLVGTLINKHSYVVCVLIMPVIYRMLCVVWPFPHACWQWPRLTIQQQAFNNGLLLPSHREYHSHFLRNKIFLILANYR